tara:strand:+ start:81 stop:482 length:402 start_codon:yes stop_codon:yes gene_type:complete
MAQHDYDIVNATGAAVRADLNNMADAMVSNNSGATEPASMFAYMWWADTTTGLMKQRNAANNAWINIGALGVENFGIGGGPSLGTNSIVRTNAKVIAENITFAGTENGSSVGPITVDSGYTVTVASGSTWVIL